MKYGIIRAEVTTMKKLKTDKGRLSIDVKPEEHRQIKIYATIHGVSIREYVLESVRKRLQEEAEHKDLSSMTSVPSSVLTELWNNEKDSAYDKI